MCQVLIQTNLTDLSHLKLQWDTEAGLSWTLHKHTVQIERLSAYSKYLEPAAI